ncbi:hypothetical protein F4679DRAFT_559189 [Xylaria curta]|nr:hypothetical protein F4679DRAFT_559189 [Xylaria curta]
MSSNDSRGGRNGDHEKRQRSPTMDSLGENSHERSSIRRREFERQQVTNRKKLQAIDAVRRGQRLHAASIASQLNITPNTNEQIAERATDASRNIIWAPIELQPSMLTSYRPRIATERLMLNKDLVHLQPANQAPANRGQQASESSIICAICKGSHQTRSCCKLTGPYDLTDRRQGYKRWCPRHLTTGHSMDECRYKWDWLRDVKQVTEWLVLDCVLSPAFATNLIDWRCLLETDQPNMNFFLFPWSPEFALKKAQETPNVNERLLDKVDPSTGSMEALKKLSWQTENGQEPQFKSFAELSAHAEQEYSNLQQEIERKRQLGAKKEENDALVIEELRQICVRKRSLDGRIKAMLQQHAGDRKLMKKLKRIVDLASS